jgi:hypothetical protein
LVGRRRSHFPPSSSSSRSGRSLFSTLLSGTGSFSAYSPQNVPVPLAQYRDRRTVNSLG